MSRTRAEMLEQYDDNLDYENDSSGAMCRLFISACRWICARTPSTSKTSQRADTRFETSFDLQQVANQEKAAKQWLASNVAATAQSLIAGSGPERSFSFERMRGRG